MSRCLQEGDWRAYLDGELPAEDIVQARQHLADCAACQGLHREIAARASRVSSLMLDLEAAPAIVLRGMPRGRVPRRIAWKWAAVGIALAAALAVAFVLAPKRMPTVEAPFVAQVQPDSLVSTVQQPLTAAPAMVHRPSRVRGLRRSAPRPQYYLALDDQPIETGTVMRVAFESGIEADVIVDSDGRPRAIRAVR